MSRKRVGFAPHRQDIRGDAASDEATSAAKLRLAQQGRVGSDCLLLRTGQEGLESFVASGSTMPVYIYRIGKEGVPLFFILIAVLFTGFGVAYALLEQRFKQRTASERHSDQRSEGLYRAR
ncbi:hypothetical protein IVA80_32300 [Bradyrhizobium sp. 139]|uniref:hypothetical protein n=1 Tax=Bradyrhizobium sp. 139 TaxID=2782616 RepID=UPI001FFB6DB8|nr:hypothetical protein [Bradyrhizobium sp. 139]MCK1745324.1 hypothetical protein [Bradyrhizobium sp. 139]